MRPLTILAVLAPVALAACGSDKEKTVVVNPPSNTVVQPAPASPSGTVVVPGGSKVCPPGYSTC